MANEIPTISLKVGNIGLPTFNPIQYKATAENLDYLQNSLANLDARKVAAAQEKTKIDTALGQLESQMNEADLPWFNDYKQRINDAIKLEVDAGNFANAARTAITAAGDTAKDTLVQNRIKSNAKFQEFNKKLEDMQSKGEISKDTRDMLESQNAYKYKARYDNNGNEKPGNIWSVNRQPVRDINLAEIAMTAFKLITPDKTSHDTSTESESNVDKKGNILNIATGSGSSDAFAREWVTVDKIKQNIQSLIGTLPDGWASVEQAFDTYVYKTNQLEKQLESLNPTSQEYKNLAQQIHRRKWMYQKNGVDVFAKEDIDYEDFFAKFICDELYQKNLAYDWRTTKHTDKNSTIGKNNVTGNGANGKGGKSSNLTPQETGKGNPVEIPGKKEDNENSGAQQAADGITSMVKGN